MKQFFLGVVVGILVSILAFFVIAYSMADSLMNSLSENSLSPPRLALEKKSAARLVDLRKMSMVDLKRNIAVDTFRLAHKVTLINFWERWCLPCRQELPSLERLRSAISDTNINIIIVSTQNPAQTAQEKVVQQFSIPFFHVAGLLPVSFEGEKIPRTYIIDKSGNIIVSETGAAKWDSQEVIGLLDSLSKEN